MVPQVKRKQRRLNPASFAQLIHYLNSGAIGHSAQSLAELTGLCTDTARHYCKALVLAGEAYICRWEKDSLGRDVTPCYKLGWGINLPRKVMTGKMKTRIWRAKLRREAQERGFEPSIS